jgi:hypothetical protein
VIQETLLEAQTFGQYVYIAKPSDPPGEGPWAFVRPMPMRVVEIACGALPAAVTSIQPIQIGIWRHDNTTDKQEDVVELPRIAQEVLALMYADYTLGGLAGLRAIDVGGIYGDGISAEQVDETVLGAGYHVGNITIPLIVDGV